MIEEKQAQKHLLNHERPAMNAFLGFDLKNIESLTITKCWGCGAYITTGKKYCLLCQNNNRKL